MNLHTRRLNAYGASLVKLLGSASLVTMANAIADGDYAHAGEVVAAAAIPQEIPENVLITGSLIRGTVAVGVPVTNLSPMDFAATGALTTADLFKNIPQADIRSGEVGQAHGGLIERGNKVNLRRLDTPDAVRSLLMVDGMRTPPQGGGSDLIDPSIIPSISLDHIDILVDGASATYGSDAIGGVVNLILRRNFDGAQTQFRYSGRTGGGARYSVAQLWGRTWDGGQITTSYEWYETTPVKANTLSNFSVNHSPWGYDDRRPLGSSSPATLSVGSLSGSQQLGTQCGYNTGKSPATASKCYAVPLGTGANFPEGTIGPTAPYSASTLDWSSLSTDTNFAGPLNPSAGTQNVFDPYSVLWYDTVEARNGGHFTVDQRLTKDISFYGSGYYSNRRAKYLSPSIVSPSANNALTQFPVPTDNPYYPTGGAPAGLRVNYDIGTEAPPFVSAYELDARYQIGVNIALPAQWGAQLFYAKTYHASAYETHNSVNVNAVSAALGWTIDPADGSGTGPSFGSWAKPANVPYLNLFCDPSQFLCNSQTTLNYIDSARSGATYYRLNEKGIKADGPLFDLPGGTVRAAIGADVTTYANSGLAIDNTGGPNLSIAPDYDTNDRFVWATFAQVNVPLFGEQNAMLGLRRLELEASWRHDQYSDVGGTSNPKVSFNWSPLEDFLIRGTWGSNFRAPTFGEVSRSQGVNITGFNLGALGSVSNTITGCTSVGSPLPAATSGAGKLQAKANAFNNAMAAAGIAGYAANAGCVNALAIPDPAGYVDAAGNVFTAFGDPGTDTPGLLTPGGIGNLGGAPQMAMLRGFQGRPTQLTPELATNWGLGFQYTPTNILTGLDIQATYYIVKINAELRGFGQPTDGTYSDPARDLQYATPEELGCPDLPNSLAPGIPIPASLVPSACPQWMATVANLLTHPRSQINPAAATDIYWIGDGSVRNLGWEKIDGIDWNISYDWDMGNIGAFNIGAQGTYYLHRKGQVDVGGIIDDAYHTHVGRGSTATEGVPTIPYLIYRGRLGWSNGPWSVTGFMDYQSHYYHTQASPPNVNGNFCTSTAWGAPAGGTFPCAQDSYSNGSPPWYSFDVSIGYDTGFDPANEYLQNIGISLVLQNIFDKHDDYLYKPGTQGGPPCTCNPLRTDFGRQVSFVLTKTW